MTTAPLGTVPSERKASVPPLDPQISEQVRSSLLKVIRKEPLQEAIDDVKILLSNDWGNSGFKIRKMKLPRLPMGYDTLESLLMELKWIQTGENPPGPAHSLYILIKRVQSGSSAGEVSVGWWTSVRNSINDLSMELLRDIYVSRHPTYSTVRTGSAGRGSPPSTLTYGYSAGDIKTSTQHQTAQAPIFAGTVVPTGPYIPPPGVPLGTQQTQAPPVQQIFPSGAFIV